MRLFLISSITGQDIKAVMGNLRFALRTRDEKIDLRQLTQADPPIVDYGKPEHLELAYWMPLEGELPALAAPFLKTVGLKRPHTGYDLGHVLCLPLEELFSVCADAFRLAITRLADTGVELCFLSFHPVLYHQTTREFITPYDPCVLGRLISNADCHLEAIVSLHDDIYDIHRRLLLSRRLFTPSTVRHGRELTVENKPGKRFKRSPLLDLEQQRLLLDWRSHELTEARSLAKVLGTRHFLFHQKVRSETFIDVTIHHQPCVYYSHPISQPRRDITGTPDAEKCPEPKPHRGREFIQRSNDIASRLAEFVAIVEPADIDELRFDWHAFETLTEEDLAESILPPLTPRWELLGNRRLSPAPSGHEVEVQLLPAPPGVFSQCHCETIPLHGFESAARLLEQEIRRQIAVRDYILASQADVVVVYRPFSIPGTSKPSGGVRDEIDEAERKLKLGHATCSPSIVVLHPLTDERERRRKAYDSVWDRLVEETFTGQPHDKIEILRERVLSLVDGAPYMPTDDDELIARQLRDTLSDLQLTAAPTAHLSSMGSDPYSRGIDAEEEFIIKVLRKTEVFYSYLQRKPAEVVLFVDIDSVDIAEVCSTVKVILAKSREGGKKS